MTQPRGHGPGAEPVGFLGCWLRECQRGGTEPEGRAAGRAEGASRAFCAGLQQ